MTRGTIAVAVGMLASSVSTYAHHSQAAQYDTSKQVRIEGTLVQFQFRNPHTFIQIEAPDETGKLVRWSIEWGGVGQLNGQGVTRTTLKYGDPVIITANPSRTPTSDGFGWGTRPGEVIALEP